MFIFSILSTMFFTLAVKGLSINVVYLRWTDIGATGAVIIGIVVLKVV